MAPLRNPRWEKFCRLIVEGGADTNFMQSNAYREAGYSTKVGNSSEAAASRLIRKYKPIIDRIRELQEAHAKRHGVTVDSLSEELDEARAIAAKNEQASAMVQSTVAKGKLHGKFVERSEIRETTDFSECETTEEIAEALLTQANPQVIVTRQMREEMVAELERHQSIIYAIANGSETKHKH
jgi:phage terminase small subunit